MPLRRLAAGDAAALAAVVAFVALLFADVVFLGAGFYVRDVFYEYVPARFVWREIVRGGELPLWNPWVSAGQPLAANPGYQAFYPGTWLALLPDFLWGFQVGIVAHVALAAAGTFALLRTLGLRRETAAFGACAFGLGGGVLSLTNLLPFLTSIAWWPLVARSEIRLLRGGGRRDGAALALALGMVFLAGEQTMILQTALLVLSLALVERRSLTRRRLGALLAAGAAGLLVGAVQLVPAWLLKERSARATDLAYQDVVAWSMPRDRPLELFRAHAFGTLTDGGEAYLAQHRYTPPRLPFVYSLYQGLAVPLLFLAGLAIRGPWRWWAASLALLSYALAIGGNGFLVPWLYQAGVWRSVRYPEKLVLLGLFALVVGAARALDRLPRPAILLVAAFTLADVGLHVRELAPRRPRHFFTAEPALLGEATTAARLFHAADWPVWRQAPPADADPYAAGRDRLRPYLGALWGIRGFGELDRNLTNLPHTADYVRDLWLAYGRGEPIEPRLAAANVEVVIAPTGEGIGVFRIAALPRYGFAGGGTVLAVVERATRVDLQVRAPAADRLELRFTRDRYWRATVDGARVPLQPLDGAFAAVDVPPGEHAVTLLYRDPWVSGLCVVSLLAAAAALLQLARPAGRGRAAMAGSPPEAGPGGHDRSPAAGEG